MPYDGDTYLDRRYIIPAVLIVVVAALVLSTGGPAAIEPVDEPSATNGGQIGGNSDAAPEQVYTVDGDAVVLHPDRYLAGTPHTVDSGTFRMQYTYNASNYSSIYTVTGNYRGRPITQWGYNQTADAMRIATTIHPTDGIVDAFIFPPKPPEQDGDQPLTGIVVVDQDFREQTGNISIARYDGRAVAFDGQEIADGVYRDTYTVRELQNFFFRGNRRIMAGDIASNRYNRIDSDGIGVYIDD
jgi:hypothetical protein